MDRGLGHLGPLLNYAVGFLRNTWQADQHRSLQLCCPTDVSSSPAWGHNLTVQRYLRPVVNYTTSPTPGWLAYLPGCMHTCSPSQTQLISLSFSLCLLLGHPSTHISSVEATYLATDTLMCSCVCITLIVHSHGSGQACKVSYVIPKGD